MKESTRKILEAPDVHFFTKAIIRQAFCLDPVDALKDIELAAKVISEEVDSKRKLKAIKKW